MEQNPTSISQADGGNVLVHNNQAVSTKFSILDNGRVGIGTNSPSEKLQVVGKALATAHTTSSDARLKTNIQPITSPLDKVLALRGVTFSWNPDTGFDGSTHIGLIAQEVENVLPEVVNTGSDGYKSISYSNIVAVLVEAIKDLEARVAELESTDGGSP